MSVVSILDRSRTIARPGFSRWMVPPAALCIHLCIGQAYAFSVFNLPMSRLIGVTKSAPDDWKLTDLGWIFSIAIFFLGASAALFGRWVEEGGPRRAMVASAICFSGGFLVSALGVAWHQLWIVYLGYGVLGGAGLGLGYISPVSTLLKWFPDRPGMATGMAIMGFGGGAMIASPLSVWLMTAFSSPTHVGVAETFVVLGLVYAGFMLVGAAIVRVPPAGWRPAGYVPPVRPKKLVTMRDVYVYQALKTPQFWLIWVVLCMNVTAGIGVLGQASAMSQEMFPGRVTAAAAGGFVGLLSIFNMGGRFFWASISDAIGRKHTYTLFFLLGIVLYALAPWFGAAGNLPLFILCFLVILSMYGGGFATVPAYLRDMFGTRYVGAIHGLLITAWSVAGVLGPVLVNYIRQYQIDSGVPKAQAYNVTMYIMAGLLVVGLIANLLIKAVDDRHHMNPESADDVIGVG
ncbi:nitrate/nitrite transporter NarK [Roseiarcus fermentans]|uniref:Nitrate/nitrite transporter NarK n=1 Tax=Roseiarcus fermentans TaxID=1473586 RepID=A0A366FDE2_9HYPH|nr:OFA family MFS transporter [Roseiarcus fermentans]RBP11960.1 nitrate/nitrite transporter NarK [Roseiarcus fermentans]